MTTTFKGGHYGQVDLMDGYKQQWNSAPQNKAVLMDRVVLYINIAVQTTHPCTLSRICYVLVGPLPEVLQSVCFFCLRVSPGFLCPVAAV